MRERAGDVELLARHFWARELKRAGKRATLGDATIEVLARYPWPGNVRELQNVVARLIVAAPRRGQVGPDLLPAAVRERPADARPTLAEARETFERGFVRAALTRNSGRPTAAARELGISRQDWPSWSSGSGSTGTCRDGQPCLPIADNSCSSHGCMTSS